MGDVMEQALYNTVLAGMNLDGKGFFYVNPLEANPYLSKVNPGLRHVLTRRPGWFACACCPPNLAFVDSCAKFNLDGQHITLKQSTNYPWEGTIAYEVQEAGESGFKFAVRVPQWCEHFSLKLNQHELGAGAYELKQGYLYLKEHLHQGDLLELTLELKPMLVEADPRISADYGKQAVLRGPIVYCVEEVDNGANLQCLHLGADLEGHYEDKLLGGVYVLESHGQRRIRPEQGQEIASPLYRKVQPAQFEEQLIKLIPYFAWCNRSRLFCAQLRLEQRTNQGAGALRTRPSTVAASGPVCVIAHVRCGPPSHPSGWVLASQRPLVAPARCSDVLGARLRRLNADNEPFRGSHSFFCGLFLGF